jgi:hypothetical protein
LEAESSISGNFFSPMFAPVFAAEKFFAKTVDTATGMSEDRTTAQRAQETESK